VLDDEFKSVSLSLGDCIELQSRALLVTFSSRQSSVRIGSCDYLDRFLAKATVENHESADSFPGSKISRSAPPPFPDRESSHRLFDAIRKSGPLNRINRARPIRRRWRILRLVSGLQPIGNRLRLLDRGERRRSSNDSFSVVSALDAMGKDLPHSPCLTPLIILFRNHLE
jgi:hypothetical protein